jgi:hypothetical protein
MRDMATLLFESEPRFYKPLLPRCRPAECSRVNHPTAFATRRPTGIGENSASAEESELGLALASQEREIDLDTVDAAALCERSRLRLDLLRDQVAATVGT